MGCRKPFLVDVLSERSSTRPGKRLHHQRSSRHEISSKFGISWRGNAAPHPRRLSGGGRGWGGAERAREGPSKEPAVPRDTAGPPPLRCAPLSLSLSLSPTTCSLPLLTQLALTLAGACHGRDLAHEGFRAAGAAVRQTRHRHHRPGCGDSHQAARHGGAIATPPQ
jgi:hypothetical protein